MLIVISNSGMVDNEYFGIDELFNRGLLTFHLRKPGCLKKDYEKVLKGILPSNKSKVVLHQYHELASKYNVKGFHLREEKRNTLSDNELKELSTECKNKNLSLSSSFHSIDEMKKYDGVFDYVFLSPVFESISKPGYVPQSQLIVNGAMNKTKVIALGGIEAEKVSQLKDSGFDGIAVLGAIWQNPDQSIVQFEAIKHQYSTYFLNSAIH